MYALDTPLAQLVALRALQELHVADGAAGVLAVGGDKAAGPTGAVVVGNLRQAVDALVGQAALDDLPDGLGQVVVLAAGVVVAQLLVQRLSAAPVIGGSKGHVGLIAGEEVLRTHAQVILSQDALAVPLVQQLVVLQPLFVAEAQLDGLALLIPLGIVLRAAHPVGQDLGPGGVHVEHDLHAHVSSVLLYGVESRFQVFHRLEGGGDAQLIRNVGAVGDGGVGEVTYSVLVGIVGLVLVVGLEGVHMAVGRLVVDLLQRVDQVPELGAMLLDQFIPAVAYVGILKALRQVVGEDDVAQLLGGQVRAQHRAVGALGHVQRYAGQAGDLLGDLVLAPGIHGVPVIVDVSGEGHRGGVLFPGEVFPGGGGAGLSSRRLILAALGSGGGFAVAFGGRGGRRGVVIRCSGGGRRGVGAAAGGQAKSQDHAQHQQAGEQSLLHGSPPFYHGPVSFRGPIPIYRPAYRTFITVGIIISLQSIPVKNYPLGA